MTASDELRRLPKAPRWLNGERLPSRESLYALKRSLRCSREELLGDE